jgi:rod shape-determining protein MreD
VIDRIVVVMENRYVRLFMVALLMLGLQTTLFNDLRPFGVCLQVMLLLAASAGLARGSETGAIAGFMVGLMYDLVLTTPLGVGAIVFAVVGYLAGYAHSFVHESTWWSRMLLAAIASVGGMILMPLALTIVGTSGVMTFSVFKIAIVVAIFNAAFCLPVERLCRWALAEQVVSR